MNKRNTTYSRLEPIPNWIYEEAERRAKAQPIHNKSHRKDKANNVGCLGEVIAEHWMRKNNISFTPTLNETTHDYIINNHLTIDVKTKDRTVKPLANYDNSTPLYNHSHQKPDYFFFISLCRDKEKKDGNIRDFYSACLVGSIGYEELDRVGIVFYKDEVDPRNKTRFWTDCLNIQMSQLIPLKETKSIFKGEMSAPSQQAELDTELIEMMKKSRAVYPSNSVVEV